MEEKSPEQLFREAFFSFQSKVGSVPKESTNPFHHSKYADLDTVMKTIKPLFVEYGFFIQQFPKTIVNGVEVRTVLFHMGGHSIENTLALPCEPDPQKIGSAITYARRYGLSAMIGISCEEDDDANATFKSMPKKEKKAETVPADTKPQEKTPATKPPTTQAATAQTNNILDKTTPFKTGKNTGKTWREVGAQGVHALDGYNEDNPEGEYYEKNKKLYADILSAFRVEKEQPAEPAEPQPPKESAPALTEFQKFIKQCVGICLEINNGKWAKETKESLGIPIDWNMTENEISNGKLSAFYKLASEKLAIKQAEMTPGKDDDNPDLPF